MLRLMIIIALLTAVTKIAAAAPINYDFTGTVTTGSGFDFFDVSVGDKIAITLALDNAFPDSNPSPNIGRYDTHVATLESPLLDVDFGGTGGNGLFDCDH